MATIRHPPATQRPTYPTSRPSRRPSVVLHRHPHPQSSWSSPRKSRIGGHAPYHLILLSQSFCVLIRRFFVEAPAEDPGGGSATSARRSKGALSRVVVATWRSEGWEGKNEGTKGGGFRTVRLGSLTWDKPHVGEVYDRRRKSNLRNQERHHGRGLGGRNDNVAEFSLHRRHSTAQHSTA